MAGRGKDEQKEKVGRTNLGLKRQVIVRSSQTLDLPSNQACYIHHEASGRSTHSMGLGVQSTQDPHPVPIGQDDGGPTVAADMGGLGHHMKVSKPAVPGCQFMTATLDAAVQNIVSLLFLM